MNVLVTGGAGFIGSHLVEQLLSEGEYVTVLDDFSTGKKENLPVENPNLMLWLGSVIEMITVMRAVSLCDYVFHLAAVVGVQKAFQDPLRTLHVNMHGTENILNAANRYQKRVLVMSSSEVYGYGNEGKDRLEEADPGLIGSPVTSMRWAYGASKLVDEFLALAYAAQGAEVVVVRPFNVVGPRQTGQYGMVLPRFIDQALANQPITVYGDGSQTRCFVSVAEAVQALMDLMRSEEATGQVVNLAGATEMSILDLAKLVKERLQSDSEIKLVSYQDAYGPGFDDSRRRFANTDKLQKMIGWVPQTSLEEIIDKTAEWRRLQK